MLSDRSEDTPLTDSSIGSRSGAGGGSNTLPGRTFPRVAGGGWRVAGDGWRVTGYGWRVTGSGWRVRGSGWRVAGGSVFALACGMIAILISIFK